MLHSDHDLVVLDKPAGVSVHSSDADAPDDLLSRFATWRQLSASCAAPRRLRAHGHLDRDLSGAVILSDRKDVHAALTRQFTEGRLARLFLVALRAAPWAGTSTLRAWVTVDKGGLAHAVRDRAKKAREVTILATVLERGSDRCLLQIDAKQWGPRHVRAVLAATVGAVAGDTALGGPNASRLMMHVSTLLLDHPQTGDRLVVTAPAPWTFAAWMKDGQVADLAPQQLTEVVADAIARRHGLVSRGLGALRLIHGEAEGLDGIDVEWLGGYAVVWADEQVPSWVREQVIDHIAASGALGVYLKVRPKHASRIVDARRAALVQSLPVRGAQAPEVMAVSEGGLRFELRLGEGLGTGLFLDQRSNRDWVRSASRGKSVLNLFAHTCSFTVAAAAGGAARTVSVDASSRVLDVGSRNLEANGFGGPNHELVCDDAIQWLREAHRRGMDFDLVILDPPSFSTTRGGRMSVQKDYESLARACLDIVSPRGGWLLACTNHRATRRSRLRSWLHQAAREAARELLSIRDTRPEGDFPVAGDEPHMKAVVCEVGPAGQERGRGRSGANRRSTTKKRPRAGSEES